MTESTQPQSGSLSAIVQRACREPECPHYLKLDCPDHARQEDLGVVATFGPQKAEETL
jgi:hypothetical protein